MRRHSLLYDVYLDSPLWRLRRWWWFVRSDRRCERCGWGLVLHRGELRGGDRRRVLSVHHLTYVRLGHERRSDVQLCCGRCHHAADAWRYR